MSFSKLRELCYFLFFFFFLIVGLQVRIGRVSSRWMGADGRGRGSLGLTEQGTGMSGH